MPGIRDELTNTIRRLSRRGTENRQAADDGMAETLVATDPRVGRQYNSYRVLHRLGAGGMGHVYLAIDTRLGRHAALKFLSPKLKSNPDMLLRLQQEARTASSLNHPNILTIYDIDESLGEPFIASEFVDGVTLRQALERKAVEASSILDIATQICSALKPAHEAGVVHRDLKPGNIMVRPDGLVKVIDFGLAKFTANGHISPLYEPISEPGSVAGTVHYMSPEQARGDEVDHRTDLWSLGVLIYEMIAGQKPFDGETESHVVVAILDRNPVALKCPAGVPAGLVRVAEKALSKNPERRYQTAEEMLGALRALAVSSSSRPSKVFALALARRRKSRRGWVIAGGALLLAAGAVVWWWPLHGRDRLLGPDWLELSNYTQVTHRGDVVLASISPDGTQVVFTTRAQGQEQLHLLKLATNAITDWPPYSGNAVGLTFSPDGSTLYYTVHDQAEWGKLYAAKLDSPEPVFVLDDVDGPVTFSPDGTEFAFRRRVEEKRTNYERIIVAKRQDTGSQEVVLDKYSTSIGSRVAWSADGLLAVNLVKRSLDGQVPPSILVFSRAGKELAEYSSAKFRQISGPVWLDSGSHVAFTGFAAGEDAVYPNLIELATRSGQFKPFKTPHLVWTSLTASRDFQRLATVSSERESTLWIADARGLSAPREWAHGTGFASVTWNSDESVVYSHSKAGGISLQERSLNGHLRELPKRSNCVMLTPAAAPKKHLLVFSSNCDASQNASNLWELDEQLTLAKLTDHSQSDRNPAVSPDGKMVIYDSWPNNFPTLLKLSLTTRASSPFTKLQARNAHISPDGQHVACQVREHYDGRWRVAILSSLDGTIEKDNLPLPASVDSQVRWSPDGTSLDYVNSKDTANLWRLPLNGSSAVPLTHRKGGGITYFAWSPNGERIAIVSEDIRQDVIIFHRGDLK